MNYLKHPTKKDMPKRAARKHARIEVYIKNRKLRNVLKKEKQNNG